jgi:hypothetical protein
MALENEKPKKLGKDDVVTIMSFYLHPYGYISLFYPKTNPYTRWLYINGKSKKLNVKDGKNFIELGMKICSEVRKAEKGYIDIWLLKK